MFFTAELIFACGGDDAKINLFVLKEGKVCGERGREGEGEGGLSVSVCMCGYKYWKEGMPYLSLSLCD